MTHDINKKGENIEELQLEKIQFDYRVKSTLYAMTNTSRNLFISSVFIETIYIFFERHIFDLQIFTEASVCYETTFN